jgi:hypothetical protein
MKGRLGIGERRLNSGGVEKVVKGERLSEWMSEGEEEAADEDDERWREGERL